jgi:hypothetical protein
MSFAILLYVPSPLGERVEELGTIRSVVFGAVLGEELSDKFVRLNGGG